MGDDIQIALGDSVLLAPIVNVPQFSINSIQWVSEYNVSCDNCLENWVSPTETTAFQIIITDENGCMSVDDVVIYFNPGSALQVLVSADNDQICHGGSAQLMALAPR